MQNRAVDCSCPEGMLLAVLDTLPGNQQLLACVRCGRVELSDALVNEPFPVACSFLVMNGLHSVKRFVAGRDLGRDLHC